MSTRKQLKLIILTFSMSYLLLTGCSLGNGIDELLLDHTTYESSIVASETALSDEDVPPREAEFQFTNTYVTDRNRNVLGIEYFMPESWETVLRSNTGFYAVDYFPCDDGVSPSAHIGIVYIPTQGKEEGLELIESFVDMIDSMEEYTDTQIDHTIMLGYTAMTYAFTDIRVGVFKVGTTLLLPEGGVINLSCSATESYLTDAKRVYEEMLTSLCIPEAISIENAFYEEANNPDRITPSLWFDDSQHNYYKGISYTTALASDVIAKQIAEDIMNDASYTSDIDRVQAAATTISDMAEKEQYGMDEKGYYCSPSGVFMAGVYTCAGTTRALGRVLDYMGYEWEHMRENENRHQWCVLTMDGIKGFADGMSGYAGYGEYYSGITMPNGKTLYFAE